MKNLLTLSLIASLVILSSCKKDEEDKKDETPVVTCSFKVDGMLIEADSTVAVLYTFMAPPYGRKIDVFAYKGGMEVLEAHFDPKTGAQGMGEQNATALFSYEEGKDLEKIYSSITGQLNLSTCDTVGGKIVGDFQFNAMQVSGGTATKNITEGKFNISTFRKQ